MSRLINRIDESVREETFVLMMTSILKDCKPFIKELTSHSYVRFLYSGRKRDTDWFEGYVRSERKPRDLYIDIHEDFDKEFQKQFGYPARSNSLFCSGSQSQAYEYGISYMIFPQGNYKFLWSPEVIDLYLYLDKNTNHNGVKHDNGLWDFIHASVGWVQKDNDKSDADIAELTDISYHIYIRDAVKKYRSNDLSLALTSGNEIMLNCTKYYTVRYHDWYDVLHHFFTDYKKKPIKVDDLKEWAYDYGIL